MKRIIPYKFSFFFDLSEPNMSSSDRKTYKVELGEMDHKPCWSITILLLKVGFLKNLISVKAMGETLSLVSPWQEKSITQHWIGSSLEQTTNVRSFSWGADM